MEVPSAFRMAVRQRRAIVLVASDAQGPCLHDDEGALLWALRGFSERGAYCLADCVLEGKGYALVSESPPRWEPSDAVEEV